MTASITTNGCNTPANNTICNKYATSADVVKTMEKLVLNTENTPLSLSTAVKSDVPYKHIVPTSVITHVFPSKSTVAKKNAAAETSAMSNPQTNTNASVNNIALT